MADEVFTLTYYGGSADANRLDFYDGSVSYQGFARTLAILGHFYSTGEIIAQAPHARIQIYLVPPEPGSFKQTVLATVVGAVIAAPFVSFVDATIKDWIPHSDPQLTQMNALLAHQNLLMEARMSPDQINQVHEQELATKTFINHNQTKLDVIRSITSSSFRSIFRPVGRSVHHMLLDGGERHRPIGAVDAAALALIQSDEYDLNRVSLDGIVNSFSRSSKTGIMFSGELGRGFRFKYMGAEKLPKEDIFSWSQFKQEPIHVEGQFVNFFDGTIKKLLVYHAAQVEL